jgi:hypothetical protein
VAATGLKKRITTVERERIVTTRRATGDAVTIKASHGGFDNDVEVVTRTLERITGAKLALAVDDLSGF